MPFYNTSDDLQTPECTIITPRNIKIMKELEEYDIHTYYVESSLYD